MSRQEKNRAKLNLIFDCIKLAINEDDICKLAKKASEVCKQYFPNCDYILETHVEALAFAIRASLLTYNDINKSVRDYKEVE